MMRVTTWLFLSSLIFIIGVIMAPVGDTSFLAEQGLLTTVQTIGMLLADIGSNLVTLVITLWIFICLMLIIDAGQSTKKTDVKLIQKMAWKKFWPFAGVAGLRSIIQFSPILALVPGIILILINIFSGGSLVLGGFSILITFAGLIVGLVFAILFLVQFSFPGFENVIGGKGIIASIKGSRELVKGRFWATLVRLIIPKLLYAGVIAGIQFVFFVLGLLAVSSLPTLIDTDGFFRISAIVQQIFTVGLTVLTAPIFLITDYLVYDSLRKNK